MNDRIPVEAPTPPAAAAQPAPVADAVALRWTREALNAVLEAARRELEGFAEGDRDPAHLAACRDRLDQVRATLQMLELHGGAMLAEEMQQTVAALAAGRVTTVPAAAESLMLGMVQLPGYLARLESGEADVPLMLLPVLNDLRAARRAKAVSEINLFAPRLEGFVAEEPVEADAANANLGETLRRRRSQFQRALLVWYKKPEDAEPLKAILGLIEQVLAEAGTARLKRLLEAAAAVVIDIIEREAEPDMTERLLFGRIDRLFKQVIDEGEAPAMGNFPTDLLRHLLYYGARSESRHPLVDKVREFAVEANRLPERAVQGDGPASANNELFDAVAEALRQDVRAMKDDLDLFMRGNRADRERLVGLAEPLRRVGDTLAVIGSGGVRARLAARSDEIRALEGSDAEPGDELLMGVAGDLLLVESALSGLGDVQALEAAATGEGVGLSAVELQQHLSSAYGEAFRELARVKEAFSEYLDAPTDPAPLAAVGGQLEQVAGVLRVLDQPGAADVLSGLGPFVRGLADGSRGVPDEVERDALADAVTGVEYFLEAAIEDRSNRQDILAYAAQAAQRLVPGAAVAPSVGEPQTAAAGEEEAVGEVGEPGPAILATTEASAPVEPEPDIASGPVAEEPDVPEPPEDRDAAVLPDIPALDGVEPEPVPEGGPDLAPALLPDVDPEILDIFLEEAREELAVIQEQYPRWRGNRDDDPALQTFRRSFHTLKGSGRLVGALVVGEFAWAVENLLNRVIDGTVPADDALVGLLDEVNALLPSLIEAQAGGPAPDTAAVDALSRRAFELANAEAAAQVVAPPGASGSPQAASSEGEPESPPETAQGYDTGGEAPIAIDDGLCDIFRSEADTHLQVLDAFLRQWREGLPPRFDTGLERALHTLHGSAHMAGVAPVAELAGELESYVALKERLGDSADAETADLLERCRACLAGVVAVVNQPGAALPAWEGLSAEVRAAREGLQARLVEASPEEPASELEAVLDAFEPVVLDELPPPDVPAAAAGPAEAEAPAYDPELLEIFLEEARELVERMEAEFQAWYESPDDLAPVADLQRTLHTVKGGARLAGILELGNLSHALESMFESIVNGLVPVSSELQTEARRAVDHLANAVEHLQAEGRMLPAERVVERVEAAVRGDFLEPDSVLVDATGSEAESAPAVVDIDLFSEEEPEAEAADREEPLGEPSVEGVEAVRDEQTEADADYPRDSQLLADSELAGDSLFAEGASQELEFDDSLDTAQVVPFPEVEPVEGEEHRQVRLPDRRDGGRRGAAEGRRATDRIRVRADLLDQLVNNAGEVSIYRARLDQQNTTLGYDLEELEETVTRLREQLRKLEIETETQILSRYDTDQNVDFDPLELDRYSTIQELSRALSETVSDLASIGNTLQELHRDTDTLLLQHARVSNELQDGLLRTRMVPFGSRANHLQRVVRQTAETLGKPAELHISGAQGEIDRNILERVVAPLEHLLRNAVAHGIESPDRRGELGKPREGRVELDVRREGTDVLISVHDDGAGLDREAIRQKAIERGLLDPAAEVSDADLDAMILAPGFSTSREVTQVSGRGVGTDVVLNEVKQLGGSLQVSSVPGEGATFTVRLPFTLSISEGLLLQQGEDVFAVPHGTVDGVIRVSRDDLEACYTGQRETIEYADTSYRVRYLGSMLGTGNPSLAEGVKWFPVLLVRSGDHRVAVQVDSLLGNRQVVVKSVGPQLANIRWYTGATILADGSVALILDINSLVRIDAAEQSAPVPAYEAPEASKVVTVMVVDDSITVRKVTSRLLERHNMQVVTAKDGVDAVARLQETRPDVVLLDIEMPRMDGFELARHMQNTPELAEVPIVMITSRTGDKHRDRAMELGVSRYLGKPYQEAELLENIYSVLAERTA